MAGPWRHAQKAQPSLSSLNAAGNSPSVLAGSGRGHHRDCSSRRHREGTCGISASYMHSSRQTIWLALDPPVGCVASWTGWSSQHHAGTSRRALVRLSTRRSSSPGWSETFCFEDLQPASAGMNWPRGSLFVGFVWSCATRLMPVVPAGCGASPLKGSRRNGILQVSLPGQGACRCSRGALSGASLSAS